MTFMDIFKLALPSFASRIKGFFLDGSGPEIGAGNARFLDNDTEGLTNEAGTASQKQDSADSDSVESGRVLAGQFVVPLPVLDAIEGSAIDSNDRSLPFIRVSTMIWVLEYTHATGRTRPRHD